MPGLATISLERKFPLLISVFLVTLAVGLTGAGYHEVRQASELRAIERMQRLTGQLAEMSGATTEQRFAALRRVAADPAVVAYLTAPDREASSRAAALASLRALSLTPTDTSIVAELRSTTEATRIATRPELAGEDEPVGALIARLSRGQAALGDLHPVGDSVFYWVGAPVTGDGRVVGYVVQRRTISSNPRVERQIRDLFGTDSVSIYVASDSGALWSSLTGRPTPPALLSVNEGDPPNVVRYTRGGNARYVGVYSRIPNTPLRLIAETPYETLFERPSAYLRRSVIVAFVMLVIGIVAAWILSRRITRPLRDLTDAADAISAGNYAHRIGVGRRDETGRLADAFNIMAGQVQRSHHDLERQIAESRLLAARLEDANRAKADFLATMSHELRTPLNAIGGYVELIELGVRGPVTDEQLRDLDRVRHNQRHLLTLIGNILDFTRLDAQKLPFDIGDVRVDCVATDVLSSTAPLLDEKKLRRECVGCDVAVLARADRARLEQILLNLVSNGVRFTPPGGLISVALAQHGDRVEIVVADTGIGIPREKLAAIFEPFVQVESGLTRTVGGTGLGLTISRSLARAMGGDLTAESDGASGARFTVSVPVATRRYDREQGTGNGEPRLVAARSRA
jgi:signal transduction histidine kinase